MRRRVAVIGGGPAGLMAAEVMAAAGLAVDVYDAMPSVGRKFLMAGKGGMNITHAEPLAEFKTRYGERQAVLAPQLDAFGPVHIRDWMHGLGVDSFVGTSGRVFPTEMKAAPLLRAWLHRLRQQGVRFHVRHRWLGWQADGALQLATPSGTRVVHAAAVVLALGGGSWSRLGSDGAWVPVLEAAGVAVAPLQPANCGFDVDWTPVFRERFAGAPVKPVTGRTANICGEPGKQGEFNITATGIEGGLIYALSAPLRDALAVTGQAVLQLDLLPGRSEARVANELAQPRGRDSLANHLRRRVGLTGVKAALLRECCPPETLADSQQLAAAIKALPLRLKAARPIDEAISSAGGVCFEALDDRGMLRVRPGVFVAGEMLDWEAPTGGYLLTACFASGRHAARGVVDWLAADKA